MITFERREICKVWRQLNYSLIPIFDGVGCAVLAQLAFGKYNVDISYCNYDDVDLEVCTFLSAEQQDEETVIFITDISVNKTTAELLDKRKNVFLLDHHPTALELNKYDWCQVKVRLSDGIKTSGTMLFYHWLDMHYGFKEDLDKKTLLRFAKLVRDYDTWRWSELGDDGIICKQVNDLLYLYGRDDFINWCIREINDGVFPKLYEKDNVVLKIKQDEIDRYVESKNEQMFAITLCDKVCGVVYADRNVSELGNRLCQMNPEIDFVAMIDIGNRTVSYRTVKENINLGRNVAALFGGGGHPKAAGSQFSEEMAFNIAKYVFEIGE